MRRILSHVAVALATAAAVGGFLVFVVAPCRCGAPAVPVAATGRGSEAITAALAGTFTVHLPGAETAAPIGTAFRDAATGLTVTNAHVVGAAEAVILRAADGRSVRASVIARDEVKDLAALAGAVPGAPGLVVAAEAVPRPGDPVHAIGAPLGLGHSVTRGIVSALGREIDARTPYPALQHDAALNPGSSGGPLLDAEGRVIGLNVAMPDGFRRNVGVGYAIPAAIVARFLADARAGRPLGARNLGLRVRAVEGALAQAMGLAPGSGVLVEDVADGGAAAAAGLAAGDVVTAAAGRPVRRAHDLTVALDAVRLDQPVALILRRAGADIAAELPAQPPAAPLDVRAPVAAGRGGDGRRPLDARGLGLAFAAGSAAVLDEPAIGSAAAAAGLAAGDLVLAVGDRRVAGAEEATGRIDARRTAVVALLVRGAEGATRYVVVDPQRAAVDGLGDRGNIHPRDSVGF